MVHFAMLLYFGGASRDRTDDLIVADDALSQLSYSPTWTRSNVRLAGPLIIQARDRAENARRAKALALGVSDLPTKQRAAIHRPPGCPATTACTHLFPPLH